MARNKTDRSPPAAVAKNSLTWEKTKVAEDEISTLWAKSAQIETSEQARLAANETQIDNFWPLIEALADHCDQILLEHGFPCAAQLVRHDGSGVWWEHGLESMRSPPNGETWKFTRGGTLAQENSKDFSDPWYAGKLGFKCRLALEHFRKGDSGEPFLFLKVYEIASFEADWRWRCGHKLSILTGRKQRKSLSDIRDRKNIRARKRVGTRQRAIKSLLQETRLKAGGLEKWLKRQLLDRFEIRVSERTIRNDLKALRNALGQYCSNFPQDTIDFR